MLRRFLGFATRPLLERDADDIVALPLKQCGRNRRIDTAGHRNGDPHERAPRIWSVTTCASSPTPCRIADLFFLIQCTPTKYSPGTDVRSSTCIGKPISSNTRTLPQSYSGR